MIYFAGNAVKLRAIDTFHLYATTICPPRHDSTQIDAMNAAPMPAAAGPMRMHMSPLRGVLDYHIHISRRLIRVCLLRGR